MDVKKTNIKRFITSSDIVFVIPVYQRNYDWKKENCVQLFNDIKNLICNDKTHFIGTICYKMDGRYKSVIIDGQQRITTIMLLLKALYDSCNDEKLKKKINEQFLTNPYSDGDLKLKLKPIKKDEATYKALLDNDLALVDKNSNIYTNYLLFKDLLKDLIKKYNPDEIEDAIERLEVVEISLTDENPQIIFESLNSTGLGLTNTDLLRNYLLMSLDYPTQERLYLSYWLKIEELLGSDKMENFMVDYLIFQRRTNSISENGKSARISSKNLYTSFKKQFPNITGTDSHIAIENCFIDLYKFAKIYKHFIYSEKTTFSSLSKIDKKLYELFYLLNESAASILLMCLFDKFQSGIINEETLEKLIDICITMAFRSKVCGTYGLSSAQFAALAIQKIYSNPLFFNENIFDNFWIVLSSGNGKYSFPTDNEFKFSLTTSNLYQSLRSNITKYLLYKLEKQQPHSKELPEYGNATVEHIMPQTLSDKWIKYIKDNGQIDTYEKYLHTLGNLALTNYNSELGNKMFEEKKAEYKRSNYSLTESVSKYDIWNNEAIEDRSKRLSAIALKVWPASQLVQKNIAEIGTTYDLQSDFESFTKTKPSKCCVLGLEKNITNWTDFLELACLKFYEFDNENFKKLIDSEDTTISGFVSSDPNKLNKPRKIIDGVYFETFKLHTSTCLEVIKGIAEYFEKIYDSNIQQSIWFSIRKN